MAVDYFLRDGARVVPELFAAWDAALDAHHKYFMSLDLDKVTHAQDVECKRLAAIANAAEKAARDAFYNRTKT
ncbi:TPA: hypothetical protein OGS34_004952 [Escherichia coli]|nr:hypothetical protein [Escherichia coli]